MQDSNIRAIQDFLSREQIDGTVEPAGLFNQYRVKRQIKNNPLVSLIIPTKDRVDLLGPCIDSIYSKSTYPDFEVIIIDNQSRAAGTKDYFSRIVKEHNSLRVIPYDKPFHMSAIKNAAARWARGEHLLFLNNDIEVITPGWIEALLEHSQRNEVACAGAKLLYPNQTIQHAGVVIGPGGFVDHLFRCAPSESPGYMGGVSTIQNYRAVTGACMLIKRTIFDELGGFDEGYRVSFGDLDLCMRAHTQGYVNVYTPYAELFHHESASLGKISAVDRSPEDTRHFLERWKTELDKGDPYYNPNLSNHAFCLKYE
jgi:GT2 family glycosyltransferase